MKKFLIILPLILLMPRIYWALVRRNLRRGPRLFSFSRPNSSRVNIRAIFKKPGR